MRFFTILISLFMVLPFTKIATASPNSLFPAENEITSQDNSLSSAVSQFDQILETSSTGSLQSLGANTSYNQQRILELQEQLNAKRQYLQKLPDLVSRQFEAMLAQYPDADQARKDQIAYEIHSRYQSIENRTLQEIAELEKQLELAGHRVGEAKMQTQMIGISQSIAESHKSLGQNPDEKKTENRPHKDAFEHMSSLSQRRILSKVQSMCVIQVRSLDDEFTLAHLGK